jgi:arylsulfatase A
MLSDVGRQREHTTRYWREHMKSAERSTRLPFVKILTAVLFVALCTSGGNVPAQSAAPPPNIVLLFADDLGFGDLSSYGHPTIRTPHLDRMAAEGIRLTSFYAAAPSCTPSRAGLLTGRYPIRSLPTNLGPDSDHGLPLSEIILPQLLKTRGYRTMMVGKWHLGHARPEFLPTARGFDGYYGLLYSNDMIPPWVQTDRPLQLHHDDRPLPGPVDQRQLTTGHTAEALRFIRAANGEPFFLYLAYSMPHVPLAVPVERERRSRAGLYGDVIETIDWSAGEILRTLAEEGLDERTLVVFTSDNGPWLDMPDRMFREDIVKPWHAGSAGHLRGAKATTWEGGLRVPFIARWPGRIPAGQVSADLAATLDLVPTFVRLAGAALPGDRPIDGHDLLPFLQGCGASPREEFLYYLGERLEGIRQGRWKLRQVQTGSGSIVRELYDLDTDPGERYDRAGEYPELVGRLERRMQTLDREARGARSASNRTRTFEGN